MLNTHVIELGVRNPKETKKEYLEAGEVGYVAATIRDAKEVQCGWYYNLGWKSSIGTSSRIQT